MSLFKQLVKEAKKANLRAFLLNEDNPYEVKEWVSTGCYALNALLSKGDIFAGLPKGKRIMLAGESSTAKSLFTAFMIKSYILSQENGYAIFFESEGSSTVDMCKSIGIPDDRVIIIPVDTIESCRTQMVRQLDKIIDDREGFETKVTAKGEIKRVKLNNHTPSNETFIMCIDSLGMLSTAKETGDVSAGNDKKDMTRAALIKGFARVTSLKISLAQIPLIVVNHVYATMDKYSPLEIGGGSGGKYMSDVVLLLQKYKEKEGKSQVGVRIKATALKSRWVIENKAMDIILHFKKGLAKFSSLVEVAYELGVFKKEGFSFILPDGVKAKMKEVRTKPSKFLNETVLSAIGNAIKEDLTFGKEGGVDDQEDDCINDQEDDMDSDFDDQEDDIDIEVDLEE